MIPFASPMMVPSASGSGLPSARYWRVLCTANGGGDNVAIAELEMYESGFGRNVCSGGTASASSEFSFAYSADEAFSGNLYDELGNSAVIWASGTFTGSEWLRYDFGAGVSRSIVAIGVHGRLTSAANQNPTAFSVQYSSDGTTWTTAWSESGLTWGGYEFKRFVNPAYSVPTYSGAPWASKTRWQLVIRNATGGAPALAELQHRLTPAGADQFSGGTASASSEFSATYSADKGVDNNSSTFWASSGGLYQWWQYDFASGKSFVELVLQARPSGPTNQGPQAFAYRYWDTTLGTWTTALAKHSLSAWALGETRTYTDPLYI